MRVFQKTYVELLGKNYFKHCRPIFIKKLIDPSGSTYVGQGRGQLNGQFLVKTYLCYLIFYFIKHLEVQKHIKIGLFYIYFLLSFFNIKQYRWGFFAVFCNNCVKMLGFFSNQAF